MNTLIKNKNKKKTIHHKVWVSLRQVTNEAQCKETKERSTCFKTQEQATEHFCLSMNCQVIKWQVGIMSSRKLIAHKQENP